MSTLKTFGLCAPVPVPVDTLVEFTLRELGHAPCDSGSLLPKTSWNPWRFHKEPTECVIQVPARDGTTHPCEGKEFIVTAGYLRQPSGAGGGVSLRCVTAKEAEFGETSVLLAFDTDRDNWDYPGEAIVWTTMAHISARLRNALSWPQDEPVAAMIFGSWTSPEMRGRDNTF